MLRTPTFLEKVRKMEAASTHEDYLCKAMEAYLDLFPVQNSYFFRYSHIGYLAEGVLGFLEGEYANISTIRDDVRSIPGIYTAIKERQAKYYEGSEYLKQIGTKYVSTEVSGVFVPISIHSIVTGYFISTEFEPDIIVDEELLASFTLFGELVGKSLYALIDLVGSSVHLSKRELEVMRKISHGESTKEIASSLYISEVTVNQYVKSAIKKLEARNRTEAAVKLVRMGVI